MKVTSSDLLAILRRFDVAGESHVPRNLDQIKQSHPSTINQLVGFRFERNHYFVLFDETAEDNVDYILSQIKSAKSDAHGTLLINPTTHVETHGLPFKGKDAYLFHLTSDKVRLDLMLVEKHPEISRSTWQKHIKAGHVLVNGTPAASTKLEVSGADAITIEIPDQTDFSNLELPILYLDDNVIVVDKPAGVLTHSKGALNDEFTVADFFRRYTSVGLDTTRPGIVHRLDRDTSGVIIGARTPEAFDLLKSQFADRKAKKEYLAIVKGTLAQSSALVDIPIERNPTSPSAFRAGSNGKQAVTSYEVLDANGSSSLVLLRPRTGRTHQLRVHMSYLGHPIIGDRVYGKAADRFISMPLSLRLLFQVANEKYLRLTHPRNF
jgi:23S rRNA pseudouridine1911/1915/1917 synthase